MGFRAPPAHRARWREDRLGLIEFFAANIRNKKTPVPRSRFKSLLAHEGQRGSRPEAYIAPSLPTVSTSRSAGIAANKVRLSTSTFFSRASAHRASRASLARPHGFLRQSPSGSAGRALGRPPAASGGYFPQRDGGSYCNLFCRRCSMKLGVPSTFCRLDFHRGVPASLQVSN
jgi:hypothetical protein